MKTIISKFLQESTMPVSNFFILEGIISFNEKRIHFYEHDRLLRLLLHEFAHMKYISLRSIMGDIYTNLRGRNR